MSVCCIKSLMCLNLKFNFHLYIRCYVLFVSYGHVGTDQLIRKHSLQLVFWKCYSTCPDLLIDLSHLILKICCMCVCWGFTSGRCGHIRYWFVLAYQHWSGIRPQFLLMELILGMPIYIGWWASHYMLTMYFSHNLGPSIVRLSADHVFSTITFVCLVLYISVSSMIANLLQCMYIHCIYLSSMYLYECHSLPSLHSCNQQCPLVWPLDLVLSLAWGGMSMLFIFGSCLWLRPGHTESRHWTVSI